MKNDNNVVIFMRDTLRKKVAALTREVRRLEREKKFLLEQRLALELEIKGRR